jgi:hypothetical protein
MDNTKIIGIDLEDYSGHAIENIRFSEEIEIDLEEFTIRLENFSFSETYNDDDGLVARIQYDLDEEGGDEEEVTQTHIEIMDILLENSDGELEDEQEISNRIMTALEIIIL